ncbi:MAG TPA: transposase [Gallionella sp.]|nr:transposase [Gallionella sp.]
MEHYVALDVSLKEISICVLNEKGGVTFEGKTAADPSALVDVIRSKAPGVVRVGLETGATTPWLFHSLTAGGLPVVCMDARHASAALSMRPRKSDRSDARGLADIFRMGWYRASWGDKIDPGENHDLGRVRQGGGNCGVE